MCFRCGDSVGISPELSSPHLATTAVFDCGKVRAMATLINVGVVTPLSCGDELVTTSTDASYKIHYSAKK